MIARVAAMGLGNMMTAARRIASRPRWSPLSASTGTSGTQPVESANDPSPEEIAAIRRRAEERSGFRDDSAYFEFLIERAIERAATTS